MNKRNLLIAAFLFMLICMGIPAAPANASGDGSGSDANNRFVVDNYDYGWKASYLVSKTYQNETHCSWHAHYEWDIDGVYYELTEFDNKPCWYDQVTPVPRDQPTLGHRVIKKCDAKHHSKKFKRNHKAHMRRCH